jgi:hypothetical protein
MLERFRTTIEIIVPAARVPEIIPTFPILRRSGNNMLERFDCSRTIAKLVCRIAPKTRQPERGIRKRKLPTCDVQSPGEVVLADERSNQVCCDADIRRSTAVRNLKVAHRRIDVAEIGPEHPEDGIESNRVSTGRKCTLRNRGGFHEKACPRGRQGVADCSRGRVVNRGS